MKVVVPIDHTPDSQSLIDALIGMQWHLGTQIKLITVVPRWVEFAAAQVTIPASLRELEALAVELRNALRHCDVSFSVREGNPKAEIVGFAHEVDADLILMPATNDGASEGRWMGSVSQSVLENAGCPIFFARSVDDPLTDPQSCFNSILVPIDDSVYAEAAMQWLLNFKWSAKTRFTFISVIEDQGAFALAEKSSQERIERLSPALGSNMRYEVVSGDPTETIISFACQYEADLIVIGSHARTGLHRLMLGSVSESLAFRGPCSVAVVRGILAKDSSWHRTGVFTKPKIEPVHIERPRPLYSRSNDLPHVLPGGMH